MSEETKVCRCGHERDDHGSRTEQRRGEKVYVQKCEHCPCETFTDKAGQMSRLIDSLNVVPEWREKRSTWYQGRIAGLEAENARLKTELQALEHEMRREVEWSSATADVVMRWVNRLAVLRETEQP